MRAEIAGTRAGRIRTLEAGIGSGARHRRPRRNADLEVAEESIRNLEMEVRDKTRQARGGQRHRSRNGAPSSPKASARSCSATAASSSSRPISRNALATVSDSAARDRRGSRARRPGARADPHRRQHRFRARARPPHAHRTRRGQRNGARHQARQPLPRGAARRPGAHLDRGPEQHQRRVRERQTRRAPGAQGRRPGDHRPDASSATRFAPSGWTVLEASMSVRL